MESLNGEPNSKEASTSKSQETASKDHSMSGTEQDSEKSKQKEKTKTVPFHRLFKFADSADIALMIVGTIGAIGNGCCMPIMALLYGELVDSFGQNLKADEVSKAAVKFVYLGIGAGIASFFQVTCWMITGERQGIKIRGLYLKAILRQDIAFFDNETNTGEVVGRMSGDTVLIQDAMGEKLVATFIGGSVVACMKGWLLTLVMLSSIPLVVISCGIMAMMISKMASRGQSAYAKAATVVEQTIGSIKTVASFTGEEHATSNYKKFLVTAYNSGVQEGLAAGIGMGMANFIILCSYALAVWYGGKLIIEKGYTGGQVVNVMFAVLTGSMSLGNASPCLSAFGAGQAAAFKMFETINRKPKIDAYDTVGKKMDDIRGDIELRNVYFSYPARPNEQLFSGFSLSIPSGTTAALIGQSGSGKSTVIGLIERFYDPQAGDVLIDGINLKEFQLQWIRKKIGLVSQEPMLFTGSILDNIAYGKDDATTEEIRAATELANAAKFIDKLPQGINSMVGERGTQLSGGQKQRIAIARAILKDPRILLLDEATSALDAESEKAVQEALDRIMGNKTTVIVAHRLKTVRNADMIAVIHGGKIVEKGTHSDLVKDLEGAYSQLIHLQEVSKESEQAADFQSKSEISRDSLKHYSQRMSIQQSKSCGSSVGNSILHPFSVSCDLPQTSDAALGEPACPSQPTEELIPEIPTKRLAYLNKPEIPFILAGTIAAVCNGVIAPIYGILISNVIETFFKPHHELKEHSKFWAGIYLVYGTVTLFLYPAKSYFFAIAGNRLIQRIRSVCFEKVVHMEVGWFDQPGHSSGTIGARLSVDAASIRDLVGDALSQIVQSIATVAAGLIISFTASWELALIILVLLPFMGISGYIQIKFMKGVSADSKMMYEEASQVANDAVGSIRTIASFCAEEKVVQLYKKKCDAPVKAGIWQGLVSGGGFGASFFLLFSSYAASFYAGARLVEDGKATVSDVFIVFFSLSGTAIIISQSSSFISNSNKVKNAAVSIFSIIDHKSKIDASDESGIKLENMEGEIELHHVNFNYPINPDIQIFRGLNLKIRASKSVALVGESGSGKSTVISLLQRFYDPDSGYITLDGVEIQKLQLKWLRQQMGLVSQEPALFNDTIRANIAYGKGGDATEVEIQAASELANAHEFISSLKQGYHTMVGERGVQLSGGQKQRVAIARAIAKDPKILLLDEATSALDAESERVVQDALDRVMKNRTTVVVAHRLSTIKNADMIAVVKNGVIVEKGKHENLINIPNGFYASLLACHS